MTAKQLQHEIEQACLQSDQNSDQIAPIVERLLSALESGEIRAAEPRDDGGWTVHPWVKQGILLGFRHSPSKNFEQAATLQFVDKQWFAPRTIESLNGVRVVPGGSAVRRGSFIGSGTVLMPPCYVNVGAHVGEGSMIDSHALVGSCAQVGRSVHLSAGAQLGGVLEPPGALPVIIEDHVFVGGLAAVFEGVRVQRNAVIGAGVVLTRSTPVYDLQREMTLSADDQGVLTIPPGAVVIAGSRPASGAWAKERNLQLAAALIVKQRDEGTDARSALEQALR